MRYARQSRLYLHPPPPPPLRLDDDTGLGHDVLILMSSSVTQGDHKLLKGDLSTSFRIDIRVGGTKNVRKRRYVLKARTKENIL
jgi:hypothetical protein